MSNYQSLLEIEGVDGLAVLDANSNVLETYGDIQINEDSKAQFSDVLRQDFDQELGDISSALLLCEMGVWHLLRLGNIALGDGPAYIAILAGKTQSVDIQELEQATMMLGGNHATTT